MEADDADVKGEPLQQQARISAVELQHLDWFWPRVLPWIEAALSESVQHEMLPADVYAGLRTGEYLMLVTALGNDLCGVSVLDASTDPRGRPYLAVICCGGEQVHRWISLMVTTARILAREAGADHIVMMGRPGWRPMLQALGCRLRAVVMTTDV